MKNQEKKLRKETKKIKTRKANSEFIFSTFPGNAFEVLPQSSFCDNVDSFLANAKFATKSNGENLMWQTTLKLDLWKDVSSKHNINEPSIGFFVVQEELKPAIKNRCEHCKTCGWKEHYAPKRSYHFIIPNNNEIVPNFINANSHIFHAIVHCDGFGHLLSVMGVSRGSKWLRAEEIMNLWDRICIVLNTKKITVKDLVKEGEIDVRVLYTIAYGGPWFKRWGYKFQCGSFGATQLRFEIARDYLGGVLLDNFVKNLDEEECEVYNQYKSLSEVELITVQDFFKFLLIGKVFLNQVGDKSIPLTNHLNAFYDAILHYSPDEPVEGKMVPTMVKDILNSNVLVKEKWDSVDPPKDSLILFSKVKPSITEWGDTEIQPEVMVKVPLFATIMDLKVSIEKAMRDSYFKTDKVVIKDIIGLENKDDQEMLRDVGIVTGSTVIVEGVNFSKETADDLIYELRTKVKCICGAQYDDGERMITCNHCSNQQHFECIRRSGIVSKIKYTTYLCQECDPEDVL